MNLDQRKALGELQKQAVALESSLSQELQLMWAKVERNEATTSHVIVLAEEHHTVRLVRKMLEWL